MNEVIYKRNYFKKIQNILKQNFKIIVILFVAILTAFLVFQLYFSYKNNQILKTSIQYNIAKSNSSQNDFQEIITQLSQEKNFFGILATLDKINIKLKEKDYNSVNVNYLNLLNKSKLNILFKSAVATHAAYSFLNIIDKNNEAEITSLINNFLSYIDPNLESYIGFKFEILYLLSVIEQENNDDQLIYDESLELYKQIQENEKISSSLKERVKKIHEYQKYK